MNEPRQFDELARHKLEERQFAFDEAAWTDMQHILAKDRDRGGAWKWWALAGAAVLLIGVAVRWNAADEQPAGVAEAIEVNAAKSAVEADPTEKAQPAVTEVSAEPAQSGTAVAAAPVQPLTRNERATQRTTPDAVPHSKQEKTVDPDASEAGTASEVAVAATATTSAVDRPPVDEPATGGPIDTTHAATDGQDRDAKDGSQDADLAPAIAVVVLDGTAADPVSDQGAGGTKDTAVDAPDDASPDAAASSVPAVADSAVATTTNDPSVPVVPTPAPPVLVPTQAPWEISALGGMMLGASNYSGANSDAWKDGVSSEWAPAFGGELMHMGRNFGLGAGLHYTTYAERLQVAQQTVTETITSDSNYFHPTPMMLLIVTDVVVIDGVTYYVTENLDTVINVLVRSTMTTTGERVVRPARDQMNRVSYFEIPVLFDAHLVQGPWSLGIRGGPMVGLLSGRHGAVPNAAMDGYTDFSDQRFTEVVFGYTARAYVRYRFNNAWSVGLEPGIKGQLMNGLSEGDLQRRTTAWGGMLSVSYRLR